MLIFEPEIIIINKPLNDFVLRTFQTEKFDMLGILQIGGNFL